MTSIAGTLDTRRAGLNRLVLLQPVTYWLDTLDGRAETVQPLFNFDGGSIPKIAWSLVGCPWLGPGDHGYTWHDWAYEQSRVGNFICTREQADAGMLELHLYCGMDPVIAYGVYTMVRAASWQYWGDRSSDAPVEHFDMDMIRD